MKHSIIILALLLFISCKKEKVQIDYLGVVNIIITGNEKAKTHFEKGLLLLHSFEYSDAREAFLEAQLKDSTMAMAYWGEAMTFNHSIWHTQDYELGTKALSKLKNIDYKNSCTELEKDFIKSVQILYEPNKEKEERDTDYAVFMETLFQKYPSNHEIAAFYSLSLLGSVPDGRDDAIYEKGAIIAKGILKENSNHPGALHYLIHSYDDPNHAYMALNAADSYAKVAPDASHALHMPSHIYLAMGMWDEVISSNINSYQASLNRKERKNLGNDARGYHAYHWLQYGYLQKNNYAEAKKMLTDIELYVTETPSKRGRSHLVFLKGTYLVNSEDWESKLADIVIDISDLNVSIRSKYHFLEGMKAYAKGNVEELNSVIKALENDYKRASFINSNKNSSFCSGVSRDIASYSDIVEAKIRHQQLLALYATLNRDLEKAEAHFLKSIKLNNTISYSFGPPSIQKPTHELYADWLLNQNRKEEALIQYNKALKMAPKRGLILKGLEKSKT